MDRKLAEVLKAGRFAIVGAANTIIDMGVYTLLIYGLGVAPYPAQVFGYSCGVLNSYICNRSWTFRSQTEFFSPTLVRFLLVNLAMLGVSTVLLWIFLEKVALGRLAAKGLVTFCTLCLNFGISRWWVFRE